MMALNPEKKKCKTAEDIYIQEEGTKMKRSEIIHKYKNVIIETMVDCYERILCFHPYIEYDIYISIDGIISTMERHPDETFMSWPAKSDLIYVITVKGCDIWSMVDIPKPKDEEYAEEMENDLLQDLTEQYATKYVYDYYQVALDMARLCDRGMDLYDTCLSHHYATKLSKKKYLPYTWI